MEIIKRPPTIFLKQQGVKSLIKGHLWIFSGAVTKVTGIPAAGDVVALADPGNRPVGWAWYSPDSRIRARVLSLRPEEEFPEGWWRERIAQAKELRTGLSKDENTNAFRLVNGEADGLPGLTVDLFNRTAVVRALTPGADMLKNELAQELAQELELESVWEKGDEVIRRFEGLPSRTGPLFGPEPAGPIRIREDGLLFEVDFQSGREVLWYSDQRRNRGLVAELSKGSRVLDLCSYNGAFAIRALAAGAKSATLVDSSSKALMQARRNLKLNDLVRKADIAQGNVFEVLRQYLEADRKYETVILDPDSRATTKSQTQKAVKAYQDSNFLALKILNPGGILATFSRTQPLAEDEFRDILVWAARDAGKRLQILARLGQPEDHPALMGHPETEALKGFLCRVL